MVILNFGKAIEALKEGKKAARQGWNGKGMFIYLVCGADVPNESLRNEADMHINSQFKDLRGRSVKVNSHIDMKATDGSIVVGWLASQTDMLAEDWEVVE